MQLSVIIVNYNVRYFLDQCLNSVFRAERNVAMEVIVVDNNSVDGSVEMVKEKYPSVIIIENKENTGFSRANNQALQCSNGEYALLLNPDTVVEEDTFEKCIAFMDSHPDAGGLGVKMIDGKGNFLPESKRGLPTPAVAFYKIFGLSALLPASKIFGKYHLGFLDNDKIHQVDILSGAFMLLRKSVLDKTGLLDENFFMYGEDIDLSYRIALAGFKNYYFPHTRIIHYKGESTKKSSVNYVFVFYKAMVIFAHKHFSEKNARIFSFLINIAIYFRASIAVLNRFFRNIFLPFIDFSFLLTGLFLIKNLYQEYTGIIYPNELVNIAFLLYSFIWIFAVFVFSGYNKPVNLSKIFYGILSGTAIILIGYSLLPEMYRFSRALILLGAVWFFVFSFALRLALNYLNVKEFKLNEIRRKRVAIVGDETEISRVSELLKKSSVKPDFIAPVQFEITGKNHFAQLGQLREVIEIFNIDEVVFCSKNLSSQTIINQMQLLENTPVEFKIAPSESMFIIGSNSIHVFDKLYPVKKKNLFSFIRFYLFLLIILSGHNAWTQQDTRKNLSKPTKIIPLNTRTAPQCIKVPRSNEPWRKSYFSYFGRDTMEQAGEVLLVPPEIFYLSVLKNKKGDPIKHSPAVRHWIKEVTDSIGNKQYVIDKTDSVCIRQLNNSKTNEFFIAGDAGGLSNFTTFTSDEGLYPSVSAIHKDKKGNIWFGTLGGGVSHYDGKSFVNFTTVQGLLNNVVLSIAEDKKGNIWFGTSVGASRYDGNSFINYTAAQGLASGGVLCIKEDKSGNLWFGTSGGGVSRLDVRFVQLLNYIQKPTGDVTLFRNFTIEHGLANNVVYSIAEDKNGNLWFGTYGGGVSRLDAHSAQSLNRNQKSTQSRISFMNFTTAQGLPFDVVLSILEDKSGNIWFGTEVGVARLDAHSAQLLNSAPKSEVSFPLFVNFTTAQGLAGNIVRSIAEDKNGNIWFGTYGSGISRLDAQFAQSLSYTQESTVQIPSFVSFTTAHGLSGNTVYSITEDNNGNLWFGTSGGGASRYNGQSFVSFTAEQGVTSSSIWSIGEDKDGNPWFGTSGSGVLRYDGKSFVSYTTAQGLASHTIWSILEDKNGNLWFGTLGGGVSRLSRDGKFFMNITSRQGLPYNSVSCIVEDKSGNLWFGTPEGVSRLDARFVQAINNAQDPSGLSLSFTNYTTAHGLSGKSIRCMLEDKNGNLWFGTGGGLSRLDAHFVQSLNNTQDTSAVLPSFTNFTAAQGLPTNIVRCMAEDKNGNIWLGTYGGGIVRYDGKSFRSFTSKDGLPEDMVFAVINDNKGVIWTGSNMGISGIYFQPYNEKTNLIPAGLLPVSNEELKNYIPVFKNYNFKTGYPVYDVNGGNNTIFQDSKGAIWIATGNAKHSLVRFNPDALNENPDPPVVVIQSVKIEEENICWVNLKIPDAKTEGTSTTNDPMTNDPMTNDSATLAMAMFHAFGKAVSQDVLDEQRNKFGDIQFSNITEWYPLPKDLVLPYNHNSITFDFNAIETGRNFLVRYQYALTPKLSGLKESDIEWSPIADKTSATFNNLWEGTYTFILKARSPEGVWSEPSVYTFKVLPPWYRTRSLYIIYAIAIIAVVYALIWWNSRRLLAQKKILEHKVKIATQQIREEKEEAEKQRALAESHREEAEKQKKLVDEKNKDITDSIKYAERIQGSMLVGEDILEKIGNPMMSEKNGIVPDQLTTSNSGGADAASFLLFHPRDIVSGDFYWGTETNDYLFFALCDSTGHGVPGAMMSVLNIALFNEAINEKNIYCPAKAFDYIRQRLIKTMEHGGQKDGFDGILLRKNKHTGELQYAAAFNAPVLIENGKIVQLPSDKMAVGYGLLDKPFQVFHITPQHHEKDAALYLFSDGFADQFGGPKNKKFSSSRFRELLQLEYHKPMQEQKEIIKQTFLQWHGTFPQVDDVCVAGVKIR